MRRKFRSSYFYAARLRAEPVRDAARSGLALQQIIGALHRDIAAVASAVPHRMVLLSLAPGDERQLDDCERAEAAAGFQDGEAGHSAACKNETE